MNTSNTNTHITAIDGLRAIAVLAIIVFHPTRLGFRADLLA
jgi:peptidoglycan/LPS O-acetylase OafA/YrhL